MDLRLELLKAQHSWISWLMVKYLLQSPLAWLFMKTNFLWAISKCGVKYFEQSAMDLRLWLLRAHYSWISWLMVMHLLQSLHCLACFYKTKFHLAISKCGVKYFEQPDMNLCLQLIKAQNSWILWLMDVSGCLTLLLLKCPCSQTCQVCMAKWCYVSYFQRLEICMQIRSVNFRKVTRTWFATRVFIFRPPETLLCASSLNQRNQRLMRITQQFTVAGLHSCNTE